MIDYTASFCQGRIIATIYGSNDYEDWIRNLFYLRRRRVLGEARTNRVDRKEALKFIRQERTVLEQSHEIIITGYSRGGAIAQNIAFELAPHKIVWLVTYGEKRTGNHAFVNILKALSFRLYAYRRRGDIIPLLPPWYAGLRQILCGRWTWPWRAHNYEAYT